MPVLPLRSTPAQLMAGALLALLMICTRGQHFATVDALPSASWAVFFLAGALLRPAWAFAMLFVLAVALDYGSLAAGTISDWCLTPAYWVLLPAYGVLWLCGRFQARWQTAGWRDAARLALVLAVATFFAYLISGGGYYLLSGHYVPTLAGFLPRVARYYPHWLGVSAGYVGVAFVAGLLATRLRTAADRLEQPA